MNLIVFDIDGTLTDSEYQHQSAYIDTMKQFGIVDINTNWKEYHHLTDSYILKINYENNLDDLFNFSFVDKFEAKMNASIKTYPTINEIKGARVTIEQLNQNKQFALAFATGSFLQPAYHKLNEINLNYDPNLVIGSNAIYEREGIVSKAIEKAKEVYGVSSFEKIISIGDGIWDFKTAQNLGVNFIGVGMKNYKDFQAANVDTHIKDWSEFDLEKLHLNQF